VSLVIDSNLVAAIVLPLSYSEPAGNRMIAWKKAGEELFAPTLWEYELTSIFRKAVVADLLNAEEAVGALHRILALNVRRIPPNNELHLKAMQWAGRFGHRNAYDAHYLALAEDLEVPLWTADQRLANAARQLGAGWVHWVGEID
jgi:predicted nucleic acid-binding protein